MIYLFENGKFIIVSGGSRGEYSAIADDFTVDEVNKNYVHGPGNSVIDLINDKIFFDEVEFAGNKNAELKSNIDDFFEEGEVVNIDFINLADVPNSYAGAGGKAVRVNNDANGLEFIPYKFPLVAGSEGQVLAVNAEGNLVFVNQSGGGGSSFLPITGTGTATGDITGDLNGNELEISEGGNYFLQLDPTVNAETSTLQAVNITGATNTAAAFAQTTDVNAQSGIRTSFNGSAKSGVILMTSDVSGTTTQYLSDTHTFIGNVGIGDTPDVDELFIADAGLGYLIKLDKTNHNSFFDATDGTAVAELGLIANNGDDVAFQLTARNGSGGIATIDGNANAQTITLTAANGILIDNLATGGTAPVVTGMTKIIISDQNGLLSFSNLGINEGGALIITVNIISAVENELTNNSDFQQVFIGSSGSTWTLPEIAGNTGLTFYIKNRGSASITLNSNAGGNDIYTTSAVNTVTITAGSSIILVNDGNLWLVQ